MTQSFITKAFSTLVIILLMVDIAFTTDQERLYSSMQSFSGAVELQNASHVHDQLADSFTFSYNDTLRMDRTDFIQKFETFMANGPALLLKDYEVNMQESSATAEVNYTLQDRKSLMMRSPRSEGIEAHCSMSWIREGKQWLLVSIELKTLDGKTPRLSYLSTE